MGHELVLPLSVRVDLEVIVMKGYATFNKALKQELHYQIRWEGSFLARAVAVRVFANGPGDLGSIPGRVIPKTQKKWYLMPPCLTLSIIRYGSRVKWSNPGKGVAPFPTPWCSSYRKGSLRVTLDYGRQLYFTLLFEMRITFWNVTHWNSIE